MMLKAFFILSFCICHSACLPRKPNGQKIKSGNLCRTTTDSRNPGAKCIFPFKFKGKTYNGCPPDLKDPSRNWCSTNVDSEGNHVRGGGNYGFCDPLYCPTHTEEGSTKEEPRNAITGTRSGGLDDSSFEGVDHGECTIVYNDECKPIQVSYTDYESKCSEVMVKECKKGKNGRKYGCMNVYKTECKNVPILKYRTEKNCEKVAYKRCGEDKVLSRLGFEPTDAEDCKIEWKEWHSDEYKDTSTKVCTTKNERACRTQELEVCDFVSIKVPFTETVEQCEEKSIKKCQQTWACLDEGWTDDSEICNNDEFRDNLDTCIELPQTICTEKEVTIEVEQKKRECKKVPYQDCSAKVPTETCTYKKIREPTTFTQSLPHLVCKACEIEYKSIYKTVYELEHVKKCMDMPKKICKYLDEKVCRAAGWGHKKICQYETMEKCYKKHEEICHTHSHKVPKSEEVIVPKTVCYKSYLGFKEGER